MKSDVEKKIENGQFEHRIETIGNPVGDYTTRYRLDLEVHTVATEIRIYKDENGKFQIPSDLKADVTYGNNLKAIVDFMYSEGVVSFDRMQRLSILFPGIPFRFLPGLLMLSVRLLQRPVVMRLKSLRKISLTLTRFVRMRLQ